MFLLDLLSEEWKLTTEEQTKNEATCKRGPTNQRALVLDAGMALHLITREDS